MKFPSYLRRKYYLIGGKRFRVICPYQFREKDNLKGQCDHELQEIRVKIVDQAGNSLPLDNIVEAFWHEVLHAINKIYNNDRLRECDIHQMAEGLNQVMQQILPED